MPARLAAAPSEMPRPQYGAKVQYAEAGGAEALPEGKVKYLQRVLGKLLCCARATGSAVLHALSGARFPPHRRFIRGTLPEATAHQRTAASPASKGRRAW